jgi:hypothetical protein
VQHACLACTTKRARMHLAALYTTCQPIFATYNIIYLGGVTISGGLFTEGTYVLARSSALSPLPPHHPPPIVRNWLGGIGAPGFTARVQINHLLQFASRGVYNNGYEYRFER